MAQVAGACAVLFTLYVAFAITVVAHFRRPRVPGALLALGEPIFERGLARWIGLAFSLSVAIGSQIVVVALLLRSDGIPEAAVAMLEIVLAVMVAVILWRTAAPVAAEDASHELGPSPPS